MILANLSLLAAPMATSVPEITVSEFKRLRDTGEAPFLLDVRRPNEYEIAHLDGTLLPLQELPQRLDELEAYKEKPIVVHCRSGARSAQATAFLLNQGFKDVKNLKGGILAWSREIDSSVPTY